MLTRDHASEIVSLVHRFGGWDPSSFMQEDSSVLKYDLVSAFGPPGQWKEGNGGVFAPEEMFFPTMLGILGYLQENKSKVMPFVIT